MTKFKDTAALENAYKALESEFTRRSQRLRALEKQLHNNTMLNTFAERLKNCFPDDDMFTDRKYDKASICIAINRTLKEVQNEQAGRT